jgi:hypothetical protein
MKVNNIFMKNTNTSKSSAGKVNLDDLKKELLKATSAVSSSQEKGAVYVAMVSSYIEEVNRINRAYKESLEELNASLEEIKRIKQQLNEKFKIQSLKDSIKKK